MLKDGTRYLVVYRLNWKSRIDIVHWGAACMMVPRFDCWCNQSGMGLKIDSIIKFQKLEDVFKED